MPESEAHTIDRASVALPHSEFLDQAHFQHDLHQGAVRRRARGQCPAGFDLRPRDRHQPPARRAARGPVYLRSSDHELPDLVALPSTGRSTSSSTGRIDSVKGGIRTTFEGVPDAPVTKFVLSMQGGKKGLLAELDQHLPGHPPRQGLL